MPLKQPISPNSHPFSHSFSQPFFICAAIFESNYFSTCLTLLNTPMHPLNQPFTDQKSHHTTNQRLNNPISHLFTLSSVPLTSNLSNQPISDLSKMTSTKPAFCLSIQQFNHLNQPINIWPSVHPVNHSSDRPPSIHNLFIHPSIHPT